MAIKQSANKNKKVTTSALLITGILVILYVLGQWVYTTFDATEERRYTLAPATMNLLEDLEDRIYIKVLLDGKFPAGFKRLKESTEDILRQFSQVNPEIEFNFENPNEGTIEEVNARREQ
ncbi:MAG: Gldg family protein, partial [Saprospiraceae bacterium]